MLDAVLQPLSLETLTALGSPPLLLGAGETLAGQLAISDVDDVTHFVLGAAELHQDFVVQSASWRGPRTPLRRALEKVALAPHPEPRRNAGEDGEADT